MNIRQLHEKLRSGELTVVSYIESVYETIEKNNYNSFITLNRENALAQAAELDKKLADGCEISGLFAVPVAVKDNILTKDLRTTGASKSLENFVPFFDAKVIERLKETDAIIIGKANLDEFAMGGSSETSYFGPTLNPYDKDLNPGGSSSGSAAAVAGGEALISFGSDTGGSVRNPADFCHIVGFSPTYGAIPRYGVISMSNSLDRIGILANNVEDVKALFDVSRGKCESDFTTFDLEEFDGEISLENVKVAVIDLKEVYNVDEQIRSEFERTIEKLVMKGAKIDYVSLDNLEYLNQVYTVIMSIEVESNIAKIDGLRYGESVEDYSSTDDFYIKNRSLYFGEEVKRRIALGNFFSSKDTDQKHYKKAMEVRGLVKKQVDDLFVNYDILLTPTTTQLPNRIDEAMEDNYSSFDIGMFNLIANLSDVPSISIPMDQEKLGSLQITAARGDDLRLLAISEKIEGEI